MIRHNGVRYGLNPGWREAPVNIANELMMLEGIINIRPTWKETLSQISTLVSGWVSAFGQPYGPCPQADTQPDTLVDTRPRIPFSVGLVCMYVCMYVCMCVGR